RRKSTAAAAAKLPDVVYNKGSQLAQDERAKYGYSKDGSLRSERRHDGKEGWFYAYELGGGRLTQARVYGRSSTSWEEGSYLSDAQGSVLRLVNATADGSVKALGYLRGSSFRLGASGFDDGGYEATGRPVDPTTGLRDHRSRWYNKRTGTWTQEDPARSDSNP